MERIGSTFTPTFTTLRPKYVGKPLEQLAKTNQILDTRYKQNKQAMHNQLDYLASVEVEDHNREYVENRRNEIEEDFMYAISTNNFEHADKTVEGAARGITDDRHLKGSIQSYTARQAYGAEMDKLVEDDKLDVYSAGALRAEAAAENGKKIEVDENGTIKNVFSARSVVTDPDIQGQMSEMTAKLKADKKPITLKDGKTMMWHNGVWMIEGDVESIDNNRAERAMMELLMSDPKNQAWFAQNNRLEDNQEIVRNEKGQFTYDKQGNPIRNYSNIDYRNKAASLLGGREALAATVDTLNKNFPGGGYNPATMTNEDYRNLFQSRRNDVRLYNRVTQAVNLVDYVKEDLNYKADPLIVDKIKRQRDKAAELEYLKNSPKVQMSILDPSSNQQTTLGAHAVETHNNKINFNSALTTLQGKAAQIGLDGKVVVNDNGVFLERNGKLIPINDADPSLQISNDYRNSVKGLYDKMQSSNQLYNNFMKNMSDGEKSEMNKAIAKDLKNVSGFNATKEIFQNTPQSVLEDAAKQGLIKAPDGISTMDYIKTFVGASLVASPVGGVIATQALAANDAIGTDVNLAEGVTEEQYINFILNHPAAKDISGAVTQKYLTEYGDPLLVARANQSLQDNYDKTSNNVIQGVIIGTGSMRNVPGGSKNKGWSRANNDRATAIQNGINTLKASTDAEGKNIFLNDSEITKEEASALMANPKDVTVAYYYKGTQAKRVFTGSVPVYEGGEQVGEKTIQLVQNEPDPYYAMTYLTDEEQQNDVIENSILSQFQETSYGESGIGLSTQDPQFVYNTIQEAGEKHGVAKLKAGEGRNVIIKRAGLTEKGELATDKQIPHHWGFSIHDEYANVTIPANDLLDVTNRYIEYYNRLHTQTN